jgi:hypothetical protein
VAVLPASWLNGGAVSLLESWEYVGIGVRVSLPGATPSAVAQEKQPLSAVSDLKKRWLA